jgi:hypothetical protein
MKTEVKHLQKLAGILKESVEEGDRIKVVYGNEFYGETGTVKEVRGGFIVVSIDGKDGEYSMHMSDVEKTEDEENDDDFYDEMEEGEINEAAYVPENVAKFAKRKGVTSLVNKVANWAEKSGKKIRGGTAIGKNYDTLILDLSHQDSAIYINIPEETVELYGEPVFDAKSFAKVLASQSSDENLSEIDRNDPNLMAMRAKKDAPKPKSHKPNLNQSKIKMLLKKKAEVERDMEQEAEPEGGPIADKYGDTLNRIDKAIAKLKGQGEWGPETNSYMDKGEIERRASTIK